MLHFPSFLYSKYFIMKKKNYSAFPHNAFFPPQKYTYWFLIQKAVSRGLITPCPRSVSVGQFCVSLLGRYEMASYCCFNLFFYLLKGDMLIDYQLLCSVNCSITSLEHFFICFSVLIYKKHELRALRLHVDVLFLFKL